MVTSAAYLLFYRRQSDRPLGGPFFDQFMSSTDPTSSQSNSRAPAPMAGEGKRLEGSSRNGLSSASPGVGVAHQAGGGGPVGQSAMSEADELPSYSTATRTQRMDLDDGLDEGIGMGDGVDESYSSAMPYDGPSWSFNGLSSVEDTQPPPNSDAGSLAVESDGSEGRNRMAEFADDEGTTMTHFDTPTQENGGEQIPWEQGAFDADEESVAEVRISPPREMDDHAGHPSE